MADLPQADHSRGDNLFRVTLEPIQRLSPLDHVKMISHLALVKTSLRRHLGGRQIGSKKYLPMETLGLH